MIKNLFAATGLLLCGMASYCQVSGLHVAAEYQDLYSTHRDHFRGASVTVNKAVSQVLMLGVGAEFTANPYHLDNGWNLYHLRFVPVFVDERLKLRHSSRVYPALHFSEGVTYSAYKKEIIASPGPRQSIHEAGIYAYGGAGVVWKLTDRFSVLAESGFKGFHFSTNDLDVNPHGITGRIGVIL